MEGACGKIIFTEDPNVVIKKVYRRNRAQQRSCSLRAEEQAKMQEWARQVCLTAQCQTLFVPRAWEADKHQYKMERIETDKPLDLNLVKDHIVQRDLKEFFRFAMQQNIFPLDFELYEQADGRVAMVDFDKFSSYKDGTIEFPWGVTISDSHFRQEYPYLF